MLLNIQTPVPLPTLTCPHVLLQLFALLDMHTQISLALPLLSRMMTPPAPAPTSRRSSAAGSTTGSIGGGSTGPLAVGWVGGTALVDGLWELQQMVCSAALGLFSEYEGSIAADANKMLPLDGTIHPLTAQVLSYLKVRACGSVGGRCDVNQTINHSFLLHLPTGWTVQHAIG